MARSRWHVEKETTSHHPRATSRTVPRILGVDIPAEKKLTAALTSVYGMGRNNVFEILKKAGVKEDKRAKELIGEEIVRLQKALESVPIEGVLRKMVSENVKRLKQINCYRGLRHKMRLPVKGQRTRSNARTKRGKRVTIGALKKKALQKAEGSKKEKEKDKK